MKRKKMYPHTSRNTTVLFGCNRENNYFAHSKHNNVWCNSTCCVFIGWLGNKRIWFVESTKYIRRIYTFSVLWFSKSLCNTENVYMRWRIYTFAVLEIKNCCPVRRTYMYVLLWLVHNYIIWLSTIWRIK